MTRLRWLTATAVRGLWARRVLTFGSLLLTVIAIASAVVGPSYQSTSSNSYVIAQLRAQPLINTGLTFEYHPSGVTDENIDQATSTALEAAAHEAGPDFLPGHAIAWQPLPLTTHYPGSGTGASPTQISVPGACTHVVLKGRCPTQPGEIAVLADDARVYGLALGSRVDLYEDGHPFHVVGVYQPRSSAADERFWFGLGRLQSIPSGNNRPASLAPWIVSQASIELRRERWYVTVDQALDVPPTLTPEHADAIGAHTQALTKASRHGGTLPSGLVLEPGNVVHSVVHQLLSRRDVARATVTPAVLALVLVALVLLSRLLSAAMSLRRGELALASLRGYGRRQLWFLGMLEPLLILLVATPIGVVGGYFTARGLARSWLVPGLPVPFTLACVLAVIGVVVVTGLVAALVVRDAVGEPLSSQIAGVRRPSRAGRLLVIIRLVLIAAAVAALVTAGSRTKPRAPDLTDLSLPILMSVAAGLVSGLVVLALAGLWVRWTARRRAMSMYVAARTVRRRREGTIVILPICAAVTIAVFTVGVSLAAGTWRASTAATQVGAPLSFATRISLDRAVGLTHELDPQGRYLMAAGLNAPNTQQGDITSIAPRVVVDSSRLARVGSWPAQWTPGRSAAQVADLLQPQRPSVRLTGSTVSITVDNHVRGDYGSLGLSLAILDDRGIAQEVNLGPYRPGSSTHSAHLRSCAGGCVLQRISFGGPAALVENMHGTARLDSFTVDGKPVPHALDSPWRATASLVAGRRAVTGRPTLADGRLEVRFDSPNGSAYAGISPTDVPAVVPVLWGRLAVQRDRQQTGASGYFSVHSIGATSESMPFRGPSGMLIDYTMFVRNTSQDNSTTQVYIWARSDTPQRMLDGLASHGVVRPVTEQSARHTLDEDAFALALRLYVVVTALVILLALAGLCANLAVQLPARRHDAASLRVVGVKRRSVMIGVVVEFVTVLGAAALAGVLAGAAAQYVVVRSITLGFADTSVTPRVLPSFDLARASGFTGAVLVVLVLLGSGFAILTVRGARTSSLRENAR